MGKTGKVRSQGGKEVVEKKVRRQEGKSNRGTEVEWDMDKYTGMS